MDKGKVAFHNQVKRFQVRGIDMVGNAINNHLIGLTEEGVQLVNAIFDGEKINQSIAENNQILLRELNKYGYFQEEERVKGIRSAYVHVTHHCNLHCIGCYSKIHKRNEEKDLSLDEIKHIFDELKKMSVEKIVISGGEPFLRMDIKEICSYGKTLGFYIEVISNGTLDRQVYEPILPVIDGLNISIDGYDDQSTFIRDKGIMPKIIENINQLKDRIKLNMVATIHRKNIDFINAYKELSEQLGVTFNFSILTVDLLDETFKDYILRDEDMVKLASVANRMNGDINELSEEHISLQCRSRCGVGKTTISIGADGSVYPCHMLHLEEFKLGNVLNQSLEEIIYQEENPFLEYDVEDIKSCSLCGYKYLCGGGCRARAFYRYKDIMNKDNTCSLSKYAINKNFDIILNLDKANA